MAADGVRRDKAALSSACESHPAQYACPVVIQPIYCSLND